MQKQELKGNLEFLRAAKCGKALLRLRNFFRLKLFGASDAQERNSGKKICGNTSGRYYLPEMLKMQPYGKMPFCRFYTIGV
jgi:hypothetical protein